MSDIEQAINDTAPVADAAPPEPGDVDYKAYWEREKSERVKERNLYRPVQNMLRDLDEDSVAAITRLAEMARNGDADGIVDWSLNTAQNVSGKDVAALIAARQNNQAPAAPLAAPAPAPVPGPGMQQEPSTPLDPETIRRIANEEATMAFQQQQLVSQIRHEMTTAGYEVEDPAGQTIINYARINGVPVKDAIGWFEASMLPRYQQRATALAQTAAATPLPAPDGTPAGSMPDNATPSEKAFARLTRGNIPQ